MKLKYFILLSIVASTTLYVYLDEGLQTKLMSKIHKIAPELNNATLYKWKNNKGEWQVTDKPPRKGIRFTTISSKDQVNVMPSQPSKRAK